MKIKKKVRLRDKNKQKRNKHNTNKNQKDTNNRINYNKTKRNEILKKNKNPDHHLTTRPLHCLLNHLSFPDAN